ncbi:hypothetical protein JRO89_XS14G0022800 [Xanthoceras sorbifolium]|uniref:Shugoshin C-terminal domain-containing protein n=1 Tax=Xanthoceras sorbifolium TaxID=99658 RepID=A0ABQ8H3F3_9ROSI|nr:hypothetical protein JRO89_XS14G0022800 [Xanthoceras sorbifolium]
MDGLGVVDTANCDIVAGNKKKGQQSSKVSKMGSPPRKRLADISNLRPSKPSNQDLKPLQALPFAAKDHIEKLHMLSGVLFQSVFKENMTLVKVVAERNKIIELSGIELQKLRINLQKVQQQNLQLAQANSQMNLIQLRALHHELGCKNGLLKASKVLLESKAKTVTCVASGNQVKADKSDEAGKIVEAEDGNNKTCKTKRRRQSKNQSSVSSTVRPIQAEEKVDDKRRSLRRQSARFKFEEAEPMEDRLPSRRQSARFKCEEPEPFKDRICLRRRSARLKSGETEPVEDLFEIHDAKFPVSPLRDAVVHESGSPSDTAVQGEHKEGNDALKDEAQESRRRSTGRPLRQAVERVQSYKEIPLKVKMRR